MTDWVSVSQQNQGIKTGNNQSSNGSPISSAGNVISNFLFPATKNYLTNEMGKFQQAESSRPNNVVGGAAHDIGALGMVLGDAVKPALELGAYAVPFGKGANFATKTLLPGAAVGEMTGLSRGQTSPGQMVSNAGIGAAGAGVMQGVANGIGGLLGGAQKAGEGLIQSQYNLPRSAANNLRANDTIGKLADYGITNINKVADVAPKVTGEDGLLTQITRDSIAKTPDVNLEGIAAKGIKGAGGGLVKDLLDSEPLISENTANKVMNTINKGLMNASNPLSNGYDATKAFNFVQDLESKASTLARGNDESRALSNVYRGVASEIKDRIFTGADAAGNIVGQGADTQIPQLTKDAYNKAKQISPKLAQDLLNSKTVGDVRSLAAPFVRASQMADITEAGQQLATNNMAGAVKGVGRLIQNPLNLLAVPLSSNAVNSGAGRTLRNIGNTGQLAQNPLIQAILGQIGGRVPFIGQ